MKIAAIIAALCVALCWGSYGTVLSFARSPQGGWSAFKPYLFVGMAYVVVSILFGSLMMRFVFNDNFDYTGEYFPAMKWGFLAGLLGAFGALFLTISLTKAGGKPAYVMPLVFGGAVTVNAIIAYLMLGKANPWMWLGMLLVAVGIVLTASNTPHGHPPKPRGESAGGEPATASPGHSTAASPAASDEVSEQGGAVG